MVLFWLLYSCQNKHEKLFLVKNGKAKLYILPSVNESSSTEFSVNELQKYLNKISGAEFSAAKINHRKLNNYIQLTIDPGDPEDAYRISADNGNVLIIGNSERGLLFAIYDLLERVGCQWLAPDFDFYNSGGEIIYKRKDLYIRSDLNINEQPVFTLRKLDLAEGRSLDSASFIKIIDWMPKVRLNTLMVPMNQNNRDRITWDSYSFFTPEIKKRNIRIEVGQHGYQNFLNASMENGNLFDMHPDWFGKNKNCEPDPAPECIFNIYNREALDYFCRNFLGYIEDHPEIDVFDLWPPDFARWNECDIKDLPPPGEMQAFLSNKVLSCIKNSGYNLKLQVIAFDKTIDPFVIDPKIEVNICPIHQNFETGIFDPLKKQNRKYAEAVLDWRNMLGGKLGIYTYYRKYAWRSLPNIIPHYIQNDLQWYASVPVQGISCYGEPGDWFTYELNHYILSRLEWDPETDIDSLISACCKARYKDDWRLAQEVFNLLENNVRIYCSIKGSTLKSAEEIHFARKKMEILKEKLNIIVNEEKNQNTELQKLEQMLMYAIIDLEIQEAKAAGFSREKLVNKVIKLRKFLSEYSDSGIVIYNANMDVQALMKHYGLD